MNHKKPHRGRFITFEGVDGAGKSTHLQHLVQDLKSQLGTEQVVCTREPGGTALGEQLRTLLLHQKMSLETEALLMFAARQEHIRQVIEPHLNQGHWVVCDRFTDATFAYQGSGRGLDWQKLNQLECWVQNGLTPDITFLFDLPISTAKARLNLARNPDKFESESNGFFEKVRQGYQQRIKADPDRFIVIDASQSVETVRQQVDFALKNEVRLWR